MTRNGEGPMLTLTVNGERRTLPGPQTVADLLKSLGIADARRVAVEVNQDLVPRARHAERPLQEGDAVEIVTLVGGGSAPLPAADRPLKIGKFTFTSRLITGTGKYATYDLMRDCLEASGCEVTT